ncbi:MAG: hypothetical protein KKA12_05025 [Alphaproteobacteria bacterium]|nr:hypothetical protein [Alphaproteobacteria bacterium]
MPGLAALGLTLALNGCISFHTVNDGITRAQIGETAQVGGIAVTPVKLLEDSRCPQETQCVWAGRVRIEARIDGGDPVELTLGQPLALAGRSLTLAEVQPEPRKDITRYSDEYRFGFTLSP